MFDQLAALIVNESAWLPLSMSLAGVAVAMLLYRQRRSDSPPNRRILAAMTLFFGVTIATMAVGHLLAVTTKFATGTLRGRLLLLYAIGVALIVPSWWLVCHVREVLASEDHGRKTLALNSWLALTLLALGWHNLPLAVPALFNVGYYLHSRRITGWAIVSLAVVANVGLFVGAVIFMASGQTFEQFTGRE